MHSQFRTDRVKNKKKQEHSYSNFYLFSFPVQNRTPYTGYLIITDIIFQNCRCPLTLKLISTKKHDTADFRKSMTVQLEEICLFYHINAREE